MNKSMIHSVSDSLSHRCFGISRLAIKLFAWAILSTWNVIATASQIQCASAIAKSAPYRVAVMSGPGCLDQCSLKTVSALLEHLPSAKIEILPIAKMATQDLHQWDVFIFPGGSATAQFNELDQAGRDALKNFIAQGGGYIGICAGAYLGAVEPKRYGLALASVRVADTDHWRRGQGMVKLEPKPRITEVLGSFGDGAGTEAEFEMYYANGPLLEPLDVDGLPPVIPLANFISDLNSGTPALESSAGLFRRFFIQPWQRTWAKPQPGPMPGTIAILAAPYHKGRVVLFSGHPELTPPIGDALAQAVMWTAANHPVSP